MAIRRRTAVEAESDIPEQWRQLFQWLGRMFWESETYRKQFEIKWAENKNFLLGDQWQQPRPQGFAQITTNQIWRIVFQSAALLTDTRPNIEIGARQQRTKFWDDTIKKLKKILEVMWFMNEMDRMLVRIVIDLFIYGKAYMKVYFDPFADWDLGDISVARIPPQYVWPDPNGVSITQGEFVCYRTPVSLWEIRRRYRKTAGELVDTIPPDATISTFEVKHEYRIGPIPRRTKRAEESAIPKAWLEEWWIRDPSMAKSGESMYPAGRLIAKAGNVLLYDGPNPYWDPWPGPWVEFTANPIDEDFYGEPDINQMKILQEAINVLLSHVVDNTRLMTNAIWIGDYDALSEDEWPKLSSRAGIYVRKKPGRDLHRDTGSPLPPSVLEVINMLKGDQQFISGLMDTGYGQSKKGGGVQAAGAIEALQLASQATIRLKSRELEAGLAQMGQKLVARIFQFFIEKRVIDLLGPLPPGQDASLVWDPDELAVLIPGIEGPAPVSEDERKMLYRQFRVKVSPGSSLALSKEKLWATQLALFAAKIIDREAVLEAIDYPNRDEITRRMQEAEMQALQMGLAGGAGGPHARSQPATVIKRAMRT
jgi:hypothetical protein